MSNTVKQRTEYYVVDVIKFVCCLFVIAIHTCLLESFPSAIRYLVDKGVFRLAVPFFFITSGFFLGKKMYVSDDIKSVVYKYIKRLFKMLIVFEPISILLHIVNYYKCGNSIYMVILFTLRDIVFRPRGGLWFVQACIVGFFIIFLFVRAGKEKLLIFISVVFYMIALVCNSYYFLVENTILEPLISTYLKIAVTARNGVFVGVPYLLCGIGVFKIHISKNGDRYNWFMIATGVFGILYFIELYCLRNVKMLDDGSLFVFLPFMIMALLLYVLKFKSKGLQGGRVLYLRYLSTGMYLVHAPLRNIINFGSIFVFHFKLPGVICFFVTAFLSFVICMISYRSKNKTISNLLK